MARADATAAPVDVALRAWIAQLAQSNWAAVVLDAQSTVVWISDDFKSFLHENDDETLGVGKHVVDALASETWLRVLTPQGVLDVLNGALPYFLNDLPAHAPQLLESLGEPFRSAICSVQPKVQPDLWTGHFEYLPGAELPPYEVQYLVTRIRDAQGALLGSCLVSQMGLRPTLLSMLARGDASAYERMARLVTPGRHQAAILFADLQSSGDMSRRMSTTRYFGLIQAMTAEFDAAVAANAGVVGKHAGDGWTAFFVADDAGGAEGAVSAAVRTIRSLQLACERVHDALTLGATRVCVNAGLHYGDNVFMGQLVPGGRLDVTALGDEVNECARVQETAHDGSILASKPFLERLSAAGCAALQIDVDSIEYQPLSAIDGVSVKALRDAGTLAVARI